MTGASEPNGLPSREGDQSSGGPFVATEGHASWSRLYHHLSEFDRTGALSGRELQQLGEAAYMLGREDEFLAVYERAFDAHLQSNETIAAASCGFWIGLTLMFRGDFARGSGWLTRAGRLVDDQDLECAEKGFLLLPKVEQLLAAGSTAEAFTQASRAADIGENCNNPDLVTIARHLQGRILVMGGDDARGFAMLDEVMVSVTSGRLSPIVTGLVYCSVIETCQKFHALNRAREWTEALVGWCAGQPDIVAFTGRCLIHRAEILILDGQWDEAGREAGTASARLAQGTSRHHAGPAHYQEGEVFRLRGQWENADAAYREAARLGFDPQPGLALLRLAQGRGQSALLTIHRALHSIEDVPGRLRLLPAAVEISLAAGSLEEARAHCEALQDCAQQFPYEAVRATAADARARVLIHDGKTTEALPYLRQAAALFWELRAPYHLARTRVLTAQACYAISDLETAETELAEAILAFRQLGARRDEISATKMRDSRLAAKQSALTGRQLQVLRLVAEGLTNPEIADRLTLSQRTIDRHVSDILTRLDVPTRAAATAFAFEHGLIGPRMPG